MPDHTIWEMIKALADFPCRQWTMSESVSRLGSHNSKGNILYGDFCWTFLHSRRQSLGGQSTDRRCSKLTGLPVTSNDRYTGHVWTLELSHISLNLTREVPVKFYHWNLLPWTDLRIAKHFSTGPVWSFHRSASKENRTRRQWWIYANLCCLQVCPLPGQWPSSVLTKWPFTRSSSGHPSLSRTV